mmetsp:Transcript_13415/g.31529  ORF Transcript_13415/g.31529 Transcript_13415/m.31529 type:complete len:243 (-) Transcript_13415:62-790(-)
MEDGQLLFMENGSFDLVDALPYIDTQLGQSEVAQQVKALIEEEMEHFEPRDYLSSLPQPSAEIFDNPLVAQELERLQAGLPLAGVDVSQYDVKVPEKDDAKDVKAWKQTVDNVQRQLEYNRLRLANLELLSRWGNKAWVAHSCLVRSSERSLLQQASTLRASREEVNKKRKLDQVSCGNELRKLARESDQFQQDNVETEQALHLLEGEVARLRRVCQERGIAISEGTPNGTAGAAQDVEMQS